MFLAILLFAGTMLLSLWATQRVKSTYAKYSQIPAASGETGAEVASQILDRAGIKNVEITAHDEMLGDHYDPIHKRLVLSSQNYHGTSCAALGVAAHECGHAIQDQASYGPLRWRMAAVGVTTYANHAILVLPLIGLFTNLIAPMTSVMLMAAAWGVIMLFNLITLPVEFDASNRAKRVLSEMGHVATPEQMGAVKKVLDAAAWTYVAAFLTSALSLLYYIRLAQGGRR